MRIKSKIKIKICKGVLLVNLGSPDSPSVPDVRRYLREFLMDGRVLDVNWLRAFLHRSFCHSAVPSETIRARLPDGLDAGRLAVDRHQQTRPGGTAETRQRPGRTGDALPKPVHPGRGPEIARAGRGRTVFDSAVSALRDVELRNGGRAGEGSRGQNCAANANRGSTAVLRRAGLHRGAGGQRGGLSGTGLRPFAVQFPRHSGAAPAQVRPDRRPLPDGAGLLRRGQPGARDVLPRAMFQNRRRRS